MPRPIVTDPSGAMHHGLYRWGRACARHPKRVLAVWLLLLAALLLLDRFWGGTFKDDYSLPGTSVQRGADLITMHGGDAVRGVSSQIVLHAGTGGLAAHQRDITAAGVRLQHLPHVASAVGPFTTPGALSPDGSTGYFTVWFDDFPSRFGRSYLARCDDAVHELRAQGITVDYGSPLGELARPAGSDVLSELIGLGTALAVLIMTFRSLAAAVIPLLTTLVALPVGLCAVHLLAHVFTFATASPTVAAMMGLGAGLDYTLFLTTRHRRLLHHVDDPAEAAGRAMATSGHAVVMAAAAVTLALNGLHLCGIGFIASLAVAAETTVLITAFAALSLAPALLGLFGRTIDRLSLGRPVDEATGTRDVWYRWSRTLSRCPGTCLAAGVLVLGTVGIPLTAAHLGHIDAGSLPGRYTEHRAYALVSKGFGPGANGQFTVVVELDPSRATSSTRSNRLSGTLTAALARTPGVAAVSTPVPSADHALLTTTVTPETGPQDEKTDGLLRTLEHTTLPRALAGTGAHGFVTGLTAARLVFADDLVSSLPAMAAFVTVTAFLLLLATFRGLLVAAKAALLNLLSVGAALSVVVAVFQKGWGSGFFGVSAPVPVEPYVPVLMLAIVFGLSMDYEIFLITRIREAWLQTDDNQQSITTGLTATARIITSAAATMTAVFLAFLLSTDIVIEMIALGLGVSVLIDATLMRLLLVPAAMHLLGRANWWLPAPLDRRHLRHLAQEGPQPSG